jgi:hypothetical protein
MVGAAGTGPDATILEAGSAFSVVPLFALAIVFVAVVVYPKALAVTAPYVWSRLLR